MTVYSNSQVLQQFIAFFFYPIAMNFKLPYFVYQQELLHMKLKSYPHWKQLLTNHYSIWVTADNKGNLVSPPSKYLDFGKRQMDR